MANAVVGSFESSTIAAEVQRDLTGAGFNQNRVSVISGQNASQGSASASADTVQEPMGFWDSVKDFFGFSDDEDRTYYQEAYRRGQTFVSVTADSDTEVDKAVAIFQKHGVTDLHKQAEQWREQGWTGGATAKQAAYAGAETTRATSQPETTSTSKTTQGAEAIPVVHEELQVGKRQVNRGGVRIYSKVTQTPVEEKVNLREEHVDVQRRPVNRPLTSADNAFKERTIEATEMAEEAVVNKQARVVEEVTLSKGASERTETVKDTVRRQDVQVEQIPGREQTTFSAASPGGASADADEWYRSDYQSHYATSGRGFDYYRPAYDYGKTLRSDAQYRGRDWAAVEADARRGFEQKNPNSKWEDFKDTVRRAYDRVTGNA